MTERDSPAESPAATLVPSAKIDEAAGLTEAEAKRRLIQYGENALVEHRIGAFERLAHFFWGPIRG